MRIVFVFLLFIGFQFPLAAQEEITTAENLEDKEIFTLQEFLAMVKKHHPVVEQADLKLSEAEAELLKARGAFDPKLEGNYNTKDYKSTDYYSLFKGGLKVPTWYGIELKADYEENDGVYLNPQNTVPQDGLWSAGVNLQLAKGLLFNERMNSLRQAQILQQQNELERQILINSIIAEATEAYANWQLYYENTKVFDSFLDNAQVRLNGVKRSSELGETRAIDTVETQIFVRNRQLDLKQALLNLQKARLAVSNYLWVEEVPVELEENLRPEISKGEVISALSITSFLGNSENLENHPEIQSLGYDLDAMDLDIRLRRNNLLPTVDVQYNFLTEEPDRPQTINNNSYKAGVKVAFPLFLRKERGELRLAEIKRENTEYKLDQKRWSLSNKIKAIENELTSLEEQLEIIETIVEENQIMVDSEKRLFEVGESSIFLVNSRENKLIDARLKQNKLRNEFYKAAAKLFEALRINL